MTYVCMYLVAKGEKDLLKDGKGAIKGYKEDPSYSIFETCSARCFDATLRFLRGEEVFVEEDQHQVRSASLSSG